MDIYISGSDQVFNTNGDYVDVFYLNFEKGKSRKIAYAASFGICEFSDEIANRILPLVQDFDALSCRENEGAILLSRISGKCQWVVDPTLLLSADDWNTVLVQPKFKNKYILIYALADENFLIDIANKIKHIYGYKVICVRGNTRDFISVDQVIYDCGPSEFIGLIKHSEYVVTDSFHGTVFSTIFDRPFYTFISRPSVSTRIYNLLEMLDLADRIVTHNNLAIRN